MDVDCNRGFGVICYFSAGFFFVYIAAAFDSAGGYYYRCCKVAAELAEMRMQEDNYR
jgi:hypothetical protein